MAPPHHHTVTVKGATSPRERYEQRKEDKLPWIASPLKNVSEHDTAFSQREEASKIELFYDLFFVANLTTFTAVHEVNDRKSLSSYTGFFAIIWTTWLQVTLFDVRFAVDSVYERICKVLQLMTMIGFASVGPQFDPNVSQNSKTFRTLTILLLISRALLAIQYLTVTAFIGKKRRDTKKPLLFISLTFIITSAAYLGLFFAFNSDKEDKRYYLWYIFIALETIAVMGVSVRWRSLSFKKTHLPERLGLLTLIILGEGVIVLTKSVNYVVGEGGWTWSSFGQVFAVVLIIYFLWALYFDRHPETHFGTIRQQIWCILHFPFHISLVLMLEGLNNFILYNKAIHKFFEFFNQLPQDTSAPTDSSVIQALNTTINSFNLAGGKSADSLPIIYDTLGNLTTQPLDNQATTIDDLLTTVFVAVFKKFNFEPPESAEILPGQSPMDPIVSVIRLIYKYFFSSAGVVVFLLAVFMWFVRRRKDIFDHIAIAIRVIAAIVLFVFTFFSFHKALINRYVKGPLILPAVLLVLALILFVDKITDVFALCWGRRKFGRSGNNYVQAPMPDHDQYPDKSGGVQYAA